jgi:glycerol-3-phosphate acyltransferase PlsY
VTRSWSLFFLIMAMFSAAFPWFQSNRGKKKWTLFFPALMAFSLALPVFMMGGTVRPILALLLVALGAYLLWSHARNGWRLQALSEPRAELDEA